MFARTIFIFLLIATSIKALAYEIICPTVNEIKNNSLGYWLPLYINGEELASTADVEQFRKHSTEFAVAKWNSSYLESAHCFYKGTSPVLSTIVLAQDAWRPISNGYWVWIQPNTSAECRSPRVADCSFIS